MYFRDINKTELLRLKRSKIIFGIRYRKYFRKEIDELKTKLKSKTSSSKIITLDFVK